MRVRRCVQWLLATSLSCALVGCIPQLSGDFAKDSSIFAYRNQPAGTPYRCPGESALSARRPKSANHSDLCPGTLVADDNILWEVPEGFRARARELISSGDTRSFSEIAAAVGATPNTNLVVAGFSGGGHQSMVFSLGVLDELGVYGLRSEIDAMSSVSGGSFAALYYAVSGDRHTGSRVEYADKSNDEFRSTNFFWSYLLRRLSPIDLTQNLLNYHDSGDSFVGQLDSSYQGVLADDSGNSLTFADLNPERPNLFLNATNLSRDRAYFLDLQGPDGEYGEQEQRKHGFEPVEIRDLTLHFSFTRQYFDRLGSDLNSYPLTGALTASAAFPLIIDPVTLRNYAYELRGRKLPDGPKGAEADAWFPQSVGSDSGKPLSFVHLTDAGVFDNVGASKLKWFIECTFKGFDRNHTRIGESEPFASCLTRHKQRPKFTLAMTIDVATLGGFGRDNQQAEQRLEGSGLPIRITSTMNAVSNLIFTTSAQRKTDLVRLIRDLNAAGIESAFADFGLEALNDPQCLVGKHCELWSKAQALMIKNHERVDCHPTFRNGSQSLIAQARIEAMCAENVSAKLEKLFLDVNKAQSGFKLTADERLVISEAAVWVSARRVYELCHDGALDKLLGFEKARKICIA